MLGVVAILIALSSGDGILELDDVLCVVVVTLKSRNTGLVDESRRPAEQGECLLVPTRTNLTYQGSAHMTLEMSPALSGAAQNMMQGKLVRVTHCQRV